MRAMLLLAAIAPLLAVPAASAQDVGGGVDLPGDWWLGEGLKIGDYFSYNMCHVDYRECQKFQMNLWFEKEVQVGTESKWLAKVVVYDGGKVIKGEMELGKVAASPSGSRDEGGQTNNLATYRSAFKSSVAWLSAFATSYDGVGGGDAGPKEFSKPSWGKIANIGGQQVKPLAIETVVTRAGTFDDAVKVGWRSGGADSDIWIRDGFPFPIKASTWTHVSSGIPPQEYALELLEYREGVRSDPFVGIVPSVLATDASNCPDNEQLDYVSLKKATKDFNYGLNVLYKPETPMQGCYVDWLIKFRPPHSDDMYLNQIQYDILVVDEVTDNIVNDLLSGKVGLLRNLAAEDSKDFLYSPSGLAEQQMLVKEDPGTSNYVIVIYGSAHESIQIGITGPKLDYLAIPITVERNDQYAAPPPPAPRPDPAPMPDPPAAEPPASKAVIPGWVKNNAGLWADGSIDDSTFVGALQYLIQNGIVVVPAGGGPGGDGSSSIPGWVKNNAGLWADGMIDDDTFVGAIQYLIQNGIIVVS